MLGTIQKKQSCEALFLCSYDRLIQQGTGRNIFQFLRWLRQLDTKEKLSLPNAGSLPLIKQNQTVSNSSLMVFFTNLYAYIKLLTKLTLYNLLLSFIHLSTIHSSSKHLFCTYYEAKYFPGWTQYLLPNASTEEQLHVTEIWVSIIK